MINPQFADKVDMSEVQVTDLLLFLSLTYVNILFMLQKGTTEAKRQVL